MATAASEFTCTACSSSTEPTNIGVNPIGIELSADRGNRFDGWRRRAAVAVELGLAAAGCYGIDKIFHNPYCGVIFRCHCTWPWAGGAAHCNIHNPTGPRCPWCNVRNGPLRWLAWGINDITTIVLMFVVYCVTWAVQQSCARRSGPMTFARFDRKQAMCDALAVRRFGVRVLAASVTFLLLGLSLGLVFYLGTDYPCFLWIAPLGANGTRCGFLHD